MKKITLLILLTLSILGVQAQTTYQLNYDSIRVNKTAGTGGTSLYGKVYLKNVGLGLVSDSILTVLNGRIRKIPVSGITPDSTVYRTVANSLSKAQTQTALNLKANIANPTFTGTVGGITAAMVGAPSGSGTSTGTNTGDQSISTVTGLQDSITKKANKTFDNVASGAISNEKLANSTISGVVLGSNLNALTLGTGLSGSSYNGSGSVTANVDTTVIRTVANSRSLAQTQTALDAKQATLSGSGIVKSTSGTISYLTDNSSNWNTAYSYSQVGHLPLVGGTLTGGLTGTTASFSGNILTTSTGRIGIGNSAANARLEVTQTTGEIFRADASGGAYRIVAGQTGVLLGGALAVSGDATINGTSDVPLIINSTGRYTQIDFHSNGVQKSAIYWDSITNKMNYYSSANTHRFNRQIEIPDNAYGSGWDGSLEVPTKNAVYDKIQTISSGMTFKGGWNASTNTPTLADGVGTLGDMYAITTGGTSLGRTFVIGGQAIYNGSIWEPIGTSAAVSSVNSLTGAIQINPSISGDIISLTGGSATANISSATSIANKLPLAGGTLTGTLNGTNGYFNNLVNSLVGKFGTSPGNNAALEVQSSSGEVFRADAASGAPRIVADQGGVDLGGNVDISGSLTATSGSYSGALSASNLSGTNTGDQTNISGNAATVTTNANLTGVVTSVGNATAIADAALSIAKTSGLQSALDLKAPLASPNFTGTVSAFSASSANADMFQSGMSGVSNGFTLKRVSGNFQMNWDGQADFSGAITASNLSGTNTGDQNLAPYALLASPTFTGTVSGITAGMVGAPSGSGTSSGTNTGDQTNILGNAATVTTNANLTGVVTSVGNTTSIANGAISNAMIANGAVTNLSGTNTGDQNLAPYALTASLGTAAFTASTAYRASSYVPAWSEVTSKPTFASVATSGAYGDLSGTPTLTNGTYTPTLTNGTNTGSSTAYKAFYQRVGNIVTVQGYITVNPTAGDLSATQVGISLPIASNLSTDPDLSGTISSIDYTEARFLSLYADGSNNRASLSFSAETTSTITFRYSFSYEVL